jgi:hypothetical protein
LLVNRLEDTGGWAYERFRVVAGEEGGDVEGESEGVLAMVRMIIVGTDDASGDDGGDADGEPRGVPKGDEGCDGGVTLTDTLTGTYESEW